MSKTGYFDDNYFKRMNGAGASKKAFEGKAGKPATEKSSPIQGFYSDNYYNGAPEAPKGTGGGPAVRR